MAPDTVRSRKPASASRYAFAHASRVAPIVITSSTSMTRWLSTWLPAPVAKAPRTASQRSSSVNKHSSGRGRLEWSRCRRPIRLARRSGEQLRLVETELPLPVLVRRHRHHHVRLQFPRRDAGLSPPAEPYDRAQQSLLAARETSRTVGIESVTVASQANRWRLQFRSGLRAGVLDEIERASAHVAAGMRKRRQAIAAYGQRRRTGQQLFANCSQEAAICRRKKNASRRMTSFRQPCRNVSPLLQKNNQY